MENPSRILYWDKIADQNRSCSLNPERFLRSVDTDFTVLPQVAAQGTLASIGHDSESGQGLASALWALIATLTTAFSMSSRFGPCQESKSLQALASSAPWQCVGGPKLISGV